MTWNYDLHHFGRNWELIRDLSCKWVEKVDILIVLFKTKDLIAKGIHKKSAMLKGSSTFSVTIFSYHDFLHSHL